MISPLENTNGTVTLGGLDVRISDIVDLLGDKRKRTSRVVLRNGMKIGVTADEIKVLSARLKLGDHDDKRSLTPAV